MELIWKFIEDFFKTTEGSLNLLGKAVAIAVIFIAIFIITRVVNHIVDKTMNNRRLTKLQINDRRMNTLSEILKKVVKYILVFIGIVVSLDLFNINTTSIIATAGIGGLAIGFGAQSLVKDIITGFFILLEDQYAVGDYVKIGGLEGIVEELGVRVTKLRDFTGELHIIPNSNVQIVTNRTRGAMRALVKISIAYEEDIERAIKVLEKVSEDLAKSNDNIIEGPTVLGVTEFGGSDVVLTVVAKTKPMEQWAVERALRKSIKEAFNREDIEIPYSKIVVVDGGKES
ncbi:mechanosensitive ion channel family protein [Gudongella oleilytica]|jgi:small conductance mechanosensitive channel|uniref:mechanosensitive ion channel family protein n=1 Tax=Gudongella oleilytica TaxID=1582259 RepID=UPI002A35EBB9|nr:mechanosensitive ion channel family protein [Gudongella oleilytica]MDY0257831.1 mechanosensitive ion channel family protein [Gudongella oleilytica]